MSFHLGLTALRHQNTAQGGENVDGFNMSHLYTPFSLPGGDHGVVGKSDHMGVFCFCEYGGRAFLSWVLCGLCLILTFAHCREYLSDWRGFEKLALTCSGRSRDSRMEHVQGMRKWIWQNWGGEGSIMMLGSWRCGLLLGGGQGGLTEQSSRLCPHGQAMCARGRLGLVLQPGNLVFPFLCDTLLSSAAGYYCIDWSFRLHRLFLAFDFPWTAWARICRRRISNKLWTLCVL